MQKTLGGDRLGSGKKMKVELRNYERSTHDLGYLFRSTMSAGTLVPFMSEIALPGDTFDIDLNCDIKTHPTIGPLFGSYKVQLDVFEAPIRLYHKDLHNNKLGIGMKMNEIILPKVKLFAWKSIAEQNQTGDLDNSQINPSSILAYLGIRGVGYIPTTSSQPDKIRYFNGVPLLAYWDIYKNYYSNKQEEIGAVIHNELQEIVTTVVSAEIYDQISNTTTAYPEYPPNGPENIILQTGSILYFKFTSLAPGFKPNPEQIMIRTTLSGKDIRLSQLEWSQIPDGLTYQYQVFWDAAKYGTEYTNSWRYITNTELNEQPLQIVTFPLSNIDTMRDYILSHASNTQFVLNDADAGAPYDLLNPTNDVNPLLATQEGLGLKTYQSDLFNNWLQTEWIDGAGGISEVTAIDTSGGSFTIDQLNLSRKVYDMLNRIAVSGGTYDDWLDVTYTHDRFTRPESPIYHGGLIKELVFQEVISNSGSNTGEQGSEQPLGTLAGKGTLSKKHKGGNITIRVNEPSYIMGIISLTPRIDYSQGNKWDVHLSTMDDLHKPALDEIGFQELITEQMAWWDTHYQDSPAAWVTKSAGKQPAWINYMTNTNRVLGNFAIRDNEMFMTLNRRYEPEVVGSDISEIKDLTTYIDPMKFNHIFAETQLDAQNFWAQIAVDITARRKMSAKVMPNL